MRAQKSNLGKSYFIQLLIQRENLSGAQLAKRLRGGWGERRGRGSGQGHTCPSGRGADPHLLPATNRHLTHVSACVFAGGRVSQPTETEGMVPMQENPNSLGPEIGAQGGRRGYGKEFLPVSR